MNPDTYTGAIVFVGFIALAIARGITRGLQLRKEITRQQKDAAAKILADYIPLNRVELSLMRLLSSNGWWTDPDFVDEFLHTRLLVVGELENDKNHFKLNSSDNFPGYNPFIAFTHYARVRRSVSDDSFKMFEMMGWELLVFTLKFAPRTYGKRGIVLFSGQQYLIQENDLHKMAKQLHKSITRLELRRSHIESQYNKVREIVIGRDRDIIMEKISLSEGARIRIGVPAQEPDYLPELKERFKKWPNIAFAYLYLHEVVSEKKFNYVIGLDFFDPNKIEYEKIVSDVACVVSGNPQPYEAYVDFKLIQPVDENSTFCQLCVEPFYVSKFTTSGDRKTISRIRLVDASNNQ